MNMQTQLLIDRYIYEHGGDLMEELVQSNLLVDDVPCEEAIHQSAQQDAEWLLTILQNDEQQSLLQIIEFHRGKPSDITIVYWVTFYLSIAQGSHSGWALRCFAHGEVFKIYCTALATYL